MTITHEKVSTIEDGEVDTDVKPSDWNAEHIIVGAISGGMLLATQYNPNATSGVLLCAQYNPEA